MLHRPLVLGLPRQHAYAHRYTHTDIHTHRERKRERTRETETRVQELLSISAIDDYLEEFDLDHYIQSEKDILKAMDYCLYI
jgi:hypothetical protein